MPRSTVTNTIRHRPGCPERRIDRFTETKPGGGMVRVTHCLDCGERAYDDPEAQARAARQVPNLVGG